MCVCVCVFVFVCLHSLILSIVILWLKDFIPKMAQEYGFEYELVQYKWPRWLLAQTEKQRIIWGSVK